MGIMGDQLVRNKITQKNMGITNMGSSYHPRG
jgi:hypothetical protein